jgi:hypothetical protein
MPEHSAGTQVGPRKNSMLTPISKPNTNKNSSDNTARINKGLAMAVGINDSIK